MIGVSSGTASLLGLHRARCETYPSIAYLMAGSHCRGTCSFCAQASGSMSRARTLSRVSWPLFRAGEVQREVARAFEEGSIKKVCIQVVNSADGLAQALSFIACLRKVSPVPAGISCTGITGPMLSELMEAGIQTVALPLDAATPQLYRTIKGRDWEGALLFLIESAGRYPGRVATHLIAGLGETEEEMARLLELLHEKHVAVGLFAFTPLPGTPLGKLGRPDLASYRRIQLAHYLIRSGIGAMCTVREGNLHFNTKLHDIAPQVVEGEAFETSGCPWCNRPLYNEKPGSTPYNYPRNLSREETREALSLAMAAGEPHPERHHEQ
ncbi:MAG: radical SAM protein [Candidatus Eremiobacteraeota bacterium]|nr:radical SAM protein [Candidatus Eremiobacteraeota bacterium]